MGISLDIRNGGPSVIPHLQSHSNANNHKHFPSMAENPKTAK